MHSAHDVSNAHRVRDCLAQAVLLGNLKVDYRADLAATHLDHADGVLCLVQRAPAVRCSLDGWDAILSYAQARVPLIPLPSRDELVGVARQRQLARLVEPGHLVIIQRPTGSAQVVP